MVSNLFVISTSMGKNGDSLKHVIVNPKSHYHLALCVLALIAAVSLQSAPVSAAEKITLGAVEQVIVMPWNIKVLARIDTGAATSSIDARDIRVKGKVVEFKLFGSDEMDLVTLPLLRWRTVRTSEGDARRPVVRLDLCIGTQRVTTTVNLNDRMKMEHALLIGRNVLAGRFVVDAGRSKVLAPDCPMEKTL